MPIVQTSLQDMGNEIFIENKKVCVKPLRSRLEAIQKLQPPKTPKGCSSFAGVVNFLSIFCPELQKLLKPIYNLTRKGRPFNWGKEQDSFDEIRNRLIKPPVLHMPNKTGRFHLHSDTSKFATGSALYQIQNCKHKLIAYVSKRLPEGAKSYSITELELCGLAINIASFSHLLKRVDFDAIVGHLALSHIIKSKKEPATTRIKRLLELLSSYSFNLYYMKGKDMILSDFLSRQNNDDSNPNEIIPISFDMYKILESSLNSFDKNNNFGNSKYLIQMHAQAKTSGTKLLEVHGVQKGLDPNLRPEKQHTLPKQGNLEKPQMGWGRAGSKRKKLDPINQAIKQPSEMSQEIPGRIKIVTGKTNSIHSTNSMSDRLINNNPFMPGVPFHLGPLLRSPKQQPIKQNIQDINPYPNINLDFEENTPFQEGIMSETFQRPDESFFQNPKELGDLINKENLVHNFLPKQTDIDKILEVIQRKVLKGTHLPVEAKEIQVGYLYSPYFKDLYLYLPQNKLQSSKSAIRKLETLSEKYVLLDSLLFRVSPEQETVVLAIPEMCTDKIITLYCRS